MKTPRPPITLKEWQVHIANLALAIVKIKDDIYRECRKRTCNATKLLVMKGEVDFLAKAMERCHSDYRNVRDLCKTAIADYRTVKGEVDEILKGARSATNKAVV